MRSDQIGALTQIVADLTQQIRELVSQVSDVAALVKVEDAKRMALEQRVSDLEGLERGVQSRRDRNLDQWRLAVIIAVITAALSASSSLLARWIIR